MQTATLDCENRTESEQPELITCAGARISNSPSRRARLGFAAAIMSALALLAALAIPILRGKVYLADDLGEFHLPLRAFYLQQLTRGEAFDWCPDLFCGFYLTGEGQIGGYHPLHLLLYSALPLWLAFDLECWLSYPALVFGMYLLLRRWRLLPAAAMFGATAFAFGGFNLLHFVHPNAIEIVAHLPWLLLAIDYLIRDQEPRSRRWAFIAIALLTGSQLLLGYPQYMLSSLLVQGGYALWIARSRAKSSLAIAGAIGEWLLAVVIGFVIGAIQLAPTTEALQNSTRQSTGIEIAAQGSLHPLNLIQLIAPYLFATRVVGENTHELGLYIGAVPLMLAMFWFASGAPRRFRQVSIAASFVVAVSLIWAIGTFGPFGWLQAHIPLLNRFRFPCRAIVLVQFGIVVLAALGIDTLVRSQRNASFPKALWLLSIASWIMAGLGALLWSPFASTWPWIVAGPVILTGATFFLQQAVHGRQWAIPALIALSAIDLGFYGLSHSVAGNTASLETFIASTDVPPGNATNRVAAECFRISPPAPLESAMRVGDRILLAGWKLVDGYAGLEPERRLDYRSHEALRVAGAGWAADQQNHLWIPLSNPQSRAWLVCSAHESSTPAVDIASIGITETALVDRAVELPIGIRGTAHICIDRPGFLLLDTDCESQQLLVINESFHSGWKAAVDDKTAEVLRADGDFIGIVVPAGNHRIALEFQPESLRLGRLITFLGLGLIVVTLLRPIARRQ